MFAPALARLWLGQQLRDYMREAGFRRVLFGGLIVLGGLWVSVRQLHG